MAQRAPILALAALAGLPCWLALPQAANAQRATQTTAERPVSPRDLPRGAATIPFREGAPPVAGLPQPLPEATAARLRRIFEFQVRGEDARAVREQARLSDRRLLGHVLAHRWLREGAENPGLDALREWLARYGDQPDAPEIHALLVRTAGSDDAIPNAPVVRALSPDAEVAPAARPQQQPRPAPAMARRAEAAAAAFRAGRDAEALALASALARAGDPSGRAAFVAGLAAWGLGDFAQALPLFQAAAEAGETTPAQRAAAAFWAARAAVRARQPALYVPWMLRAAEAPQSFYGQVARRALGLDPGFGRSREAADPGDAAQIAAIPAGWRALALLQVGQRGRAEAELRRLYPRAERNPDLLRALHQVASHAGLQHLANQLAQRLPGAEPAAAGVAQSVPMPRLSPDGGFRIDPALLYAVTRQESNFEPTAISRAGARGLMQLMPETASLITNDPTLAGDAIERLHDPGLSLELGQRYLLHLTRHEVVDGNLIRLLAAYNAGPGSVQRWQPATAHRDDPFLYIEAIPFDETRDFVRRVLSFSWAYAARLSLPAPSLDALAAGAFPRFASTQDILVMLQRSETR